MIKQQDLSPDSLITSMMYKKVLQIPQNVSITSGLRPKSSGLNLWNFSGPVGSLEIDLQKIDTRGLSFARLGKLSQSKTLELYVKKTPGGSGMIGTLASLCSNCILGVSQGFTVYLELSGVGYRANLLGTESQTLEFKVGQSHELFFQVPTGVKAFLVKPTQIGLYGIHKSQVTQIAAELRNLKLPEPYKGKGIRFKDEVILTKTGKKK